MLNTLISKPCSNAKSISGFRCLFPLKKSITNALVFPSRLKGSPDFIHLSPECWHLNWGVVDEWISDFWLRLAAAAVDNYFRKPKVLHYNCDTFYYPPFGIHLTSISDREFRETRFWVFVCIELIFRLFGLHFLFWKENSLRKTLSGRSVPGICLFTNRLFIVISPTRSLPCRIEWYPELFQMEARLSSLEMVIGMEFT